MVLLEFFILSFPVVTECASMFQELSALFSPLCYNNRLVVEVFLSVLANLLLSSLVSASDCCLCSSSNHIFSGKPAANIAKIRVKLAKLRQPH